MNGKLIAVLRKLIAEATAPTRFHAVARYRVVTMNGDSVNLQAVRKSQGMPDLTRVTQAGIAGGVSQLALSAEVLVAFVDGDPSTPVIIAHMPTTPVDTAIDASGVIAIGASASGVELASGSEPVADPVGRVIRYGDSVNVPGVGEVIFGAPAVPVVSKVRA
jgi:hypothetical protein